MRRTPSNRPGQLSSGNDGPFGWVQMQVSRAARVSPDTTAPGRAHGLAAQKRRLRHVHNVVAKCVVQVVLNRYTGILQRGEERSWALVVFKYMCTIYTWKLKFYKCISDERMYLRYMATFQFFILFNYFTSLIQIIIYLYLNSNFI